jgi:hypothetical protein
MMILTEANCQLVYQNALAAPGLSGGPVSRDISVAGTSTGWFPVSRDISGASGMWAKETIIYLFVPVGLQEIFYMS